MKLRVGIFFGGPSRDRETSFRSGAAVYDALNQSLFDPVPIFVDSFGRFILLDERYLYENSIRDFYPPASHRPASPNNFAIYVESLGELPSEEHEILIQKIGRPIAAEELPQSINIAFLCLQGRFGEDGQIQQILETQQIPYTGNGAAIAQILFDQAMQKEWMFENNFSAPPFTSLERKNWNDLSAEIFYQTGAKKIGFPLQIRSALQTDLGSLSRVLQSDGLEGFKQAANKAFFQKRLRLGDWEQYDLNEKRTFIQAVGDLNHGPGFPLKLHFQDNELTFFHPERLLTYLNQAEGDVDEVFIMENSRQEQKIIIEAAVPGQNFSCLVLGKEDGSALAATPLEISENTFQKLDLPEEQIKLIQTECERLFQELQLQPFAQIDGLWSSEGKLYLNNIRIAPDFSTPRLAIQIAGSGLNSSELLTYLIKTSISERIKTQPDAPSYKHLLKFLEEQIDSEKNAYAQKKRVAVIVGGDSKAELQKSLDAGQNVFAKLSAAAKYAPFALLFLPEEKPYAFYQLPGGFLFENLKDRLLNYPEQLDSDDLKDRFSTIFDQFVFDPTLSLSKPLSGAELEKRADVAFITLSGEPETIGRLQRKLEELEIPYNGSDALATAIAFNSYRSLDVLKKNGLKTPEQLLLKKNQYENDPKEFFDRIESRFSYPIIAKSVDDLFNENSKLLRNRAELEAYARLLFRAADQQGEEARRTLDLDPDENIARKNTLLLEAPLLQNTAWQNRQISAGFLSRFAEDGDLIYEVFDPAEISAGQYRLPLRLDVDRNNYNLILGKVKETLEKAARILNIQPYGSIDALIRVKENHEVETIVSALHVLPNMQTNSPLFKQAVRNNYNPSRLISEVLDFALEKHALKTGIPLVESVVEPAATPPKKALQTTQSIEPEVDNSVEETETVSPALQEAFSTTPATNPISPSYPLEESVETSVPMAVKSRSKSFFMESWQFLKSSIFLRNFAALLIAIVVLFWLMQVWLRVYTNHKQTLQVDDYTGMRVEDAIRKAKKNSFSVILMDSFYLVDQPARVVMEQDPKPFSRVKENRTIYLIITKKTPDEVILPELTGNYDYIQYSRQLERRNVRTRIRERQFSSKLAENTILHLYYNDQKITEEDLQRGVKVPMGSVVEFVVTQRRTGMVNIPSLVCKKYDEAAFLVAGMNLKVGQIYGEVVDRNNAYIYRQEPAFREGVNIPMGSVVNLYLSDSRPGGCGGE